MGWVIVKKDIKLSEIFADIVISHLCGYPASVFHAAGYFIPKWYWGGGGGWNPPPSPEIFLPLCRHVWHYKAETLRLLILTYGPLFAAAFIDIIHYVTMATILLNRG